MKRIEGRNIMKTEDRSMFHRYLAPVGDLRFPQKINIHFPLRGRLHEFALSVNREILKIVPTEIDFSPASFQIPHVTVYMGFVKNLQDLQRLMRVTQEFSRNVCPMTVTVTNPYLKEPRRNWIFVDIVESKEFINLKLQFKELANTYLEPLVWDVVAEPPHITVGYIKTNLDTVEKELKKISVDDSFVLDAIELSFGGLRGSCLGSIRTFELSQRLLVGRLK